MGDINRLGAILYKASVGLDEHNRPIVYSLRRRLWIRWYRARCWVAWYILRVKVHGYWPNQLYPWEFQKCT